MNLEVSSRTSSADMLLDVRDLAAEFDVSDGIARAVDGVTFSVQQGEIVGIVGESGCGKSATVRSILGLLPSNGRTTRGNALFEGRDLLGLSRKELSRIRGKSIGFVAQNPFGILNPVTRVNKQFETFITTHRSDLSSKDAVGMAEQMLSAVGITDPPRVLNGYAHELSGGMAQRVGISMALVLDPRLVVADEPTTALDVTVQRQVLDMVTGLIAGHDRSMLLVTHDLGVVAQYCQKVVVLYAGRVVEAGPVVDVFTDPSHPYTLGLLQSIPRPGKPLVSLAGRLPDVRSKPKGCSFAARCRFSFDRCLEEDPHLTVSANAEVMRACFLDEREVVDHDRA